MPPTRRTGGACLIARNLQSPSWITAWGIYSACCVPAKPWGWRPNSRILRRQSGRPRHHPSRGGGIWGCDGQSPTSRIGRRAQASCGGRETSSWHLSGHAVADGRESEFGHYEGLGIIQGDVVKVPEGMSGGCRLKVPQVGWNGIRSAGGGCDISGRGTTWDGTILQGLADGAYVYFVHSYYCRPAASRFCRAPNTGRFSSARP